MLHSRIFSFILVGVLHSSNCLQRSDYIYDRETRMVTLTTNGTTYTCRASDIIDPMMDRDMKSHSGPCLNGEKSVDDPKCIRMDVINVFNELAKEMRKEDGPSSCDAPIPSIEETLDRIEKVYRSSSLDDNPATPEWLQRVWENLTQLEMECQGNATRRFHPEVVQTAGKLANYAFLLGRTVLPELRTNVSKSQIVLEDAQMEEVQMRNLSLSLFADDRDLYSLRETLFTTEVLTLGDSHEFQLNTWMQLAEVRTNFVNFVSKKKRSEHLATLAAQKASIAKMDMLFKMAKANEMLARIDAMVREVAYKLERACDDFDEMGY